MTKYPTNAQQARNGIAKGDVANEKGLQAGRNFKERGVGSKPSIEVDSGDQSIDRLRITGFADFWNAAGCLLRA